MIGSTRRSSRALLTLSAILALGCNNATRPCPAPQQTDPATPFSPVSRPSEVSFAGLITLCAKHVALSDPDSSLSNRFPTVSTFCLRGTVSPELTEDILGISARVQTCAALMPDRIGQRLAAEKALAEDRLTELRERLQKTRKAWDRLLSGKGKNSSRGSELAALQPELSALEAEVKAVAARAETVTNVRAVRDWCGNPVKPEDEVFSQLRGRDVEVNGLVGQPLFDEPGKREGFAGAVTDRAGVGLGTMSDILVRAIIGVLEKRARAELKQFIIKSFRDKICTNAGKPWLRHTCGYLGSASQDDMLPLSLGPGFRTALARDALELPRRAVSLKMSRGNEKRLMARLVFELGWLLATRAEPYQVVAAIEHLASTGEFVCLSGAAGTKCQTLQETLRIAGYVGRFVISHDLADVDSVDEVRLVLCSVSASDGFTELLKSLELLQKPLSRWVCNPQKHPGKPDRALISRMAAFLKSLRATYKALDDLKAVLARSAAPEDAKPQVLRFAQEGSLLVVRGAELVGPHGAAEIGRARVRVLSLLEALLDASLADIIVVVAAELRNASDGLPGGVLRAVSFGAELAQAKNAEEAEAVIESAAAPVGAWRQKRRGFVAALNGYVGAGGGWEYVSVEDADLTGWSAAPVGALGIDLSWAPKPYFRPGLFVSVLDVGSLMTFNSLDGDGEVEDVDATTPLGFAQVFAPGLFVRVGVADIPVVFAAGASLVPRGRRVELSDDTVKETTPVRLFGFVAVDVTLLPF